MKAIAVFCIMTGILGLFMLLFLSPARQNQEIAKNHELAINFALFRNAAVLYAQKHKLVTGEVTSEQAQLPTGWLPMHHWRCRIEDSICYVFGPGGLEEIETLRDLYRGSFALGRNEGGFLVPDHDSPMPVPDWIPNGNMVSMTEICP